jgi:5-methylcytosine-specific restriction endonuclease McrA
MNSRNKNKPPEDWDIRFVRAFSKNPRTCVYCGFRATSYEGWCQLVIDHFIPRAAGGEDSARNYVVSCYRCNQWKGHYDPGDKRYTYLPPGKKQREELIKMAKAHIQESAKKQGRRELYEFIMQVPTRLAADRHRAHDRRLRVNPLRQAA